jgi:hypothetical protein
MEKFKKVQAAESADSNVNTQWHNRFLQSAD